MEEQPKERTFLRPGRPRVFSTYRLKARVGHILGEGADAFGKTVETALRWLGDKTPLPLPEAAWNVESFVLDEHGQRLECVSLPEKGIWTARFSHPDAGMGDIRPVPGRIWLNDLSVARTENEVQFGVQITCSSLPERDYPVSFIRPGIIKSLVEAVGLEQVRHLDGKPLIARTPTDVEKLFFLVTSMDRNLPVIVVSQPDPSRWTLPNDPPEWMIEHEELARKTLGYAHVACLTKDASFVWTDRVGKTWSVFDGAVRTYMPGINMENDNPRSHPIALKDRIYYWKYEDRFGEKAFAEELYLRTRGINARFQFRWEPLVFLADAKVLQAEARAREIRDRLAEKDCDKCLAEFDNQLEAMQEKVQEAQDAESEMAALATEYASEAEYYKNRSFALNASLEAIRASLKASGEDPDRDIPIPGNYDDMPQWVEKHLGGRVELLPRARNALKKARFEDVELVYRALLLLATDYRELHFGQIRINDFIERCKEAGLEYCSSITEISAGERGEEYYVNYPAGTSNRRVLDHHLTKGTSRDERYTLRVYFFWDEQNSQVVVGWLPSHLETRTS